MLEFRLTWTVTVLSMTWEDVANETVVPGARCETTSSRYKSLR